MALIPNAIYGHVSSSCVSAKIFRGKETHGYSTKSCGIITFYFNDRNNVGEITNLKTTYNVKLIPSDINIQKIEEYYNEDTGSQQEAYVINDENNIYVLGSSVSTQPLISLMGQTFRIKAFDKIYSCVISSNQQTFMFNLTSNNFAFTLEE